MSPPLLQEQYRLSKHARCLHLPDGRVVVAHPFYAERTILKPELAAIVDLFASRPLGLAELLAEVDADAQALHEVMNYLRERHYIVAVAQDEDESLLASLRIELDGLGTRAAHDTDKRRRYRASQALSISDVLRPPALRAGIKRLRVLVVGSCFADYSADALEGQARALGLDVEVATAWSDGSDAITRFAPDIVVIQPASTWLIAPLWDEAAFLEDQERESRLQVLKNALGPLLHLTRAGAGRLYLVQGFSTPQYSPLGIAEFRQTVNFQRIVYELNQHIIEQLRDNPDALFIDAERILGNVGKARLMDDAIAPFSHQSAIDGQLGDVALVPGPSREETYGVTERLHAVRLMSQAYLEAYRVWSGHGRIKCIITDSDRTLWPAILGESSLTRPEIVNSLRFGVYGGIHQALLIAKQRGVLLAVCSMNNESEALERWNELVEHAKASGMAQVLAPRDFVTLRINWRRKSENVQEILADLGLAANSVLFIDDEAVHRADVCESFPEIRACGENMHALRGLLLSEAGLQVNVQTDESQHRTKLMRDKLERDAARAQVKDEREFLAGLGIRLVVRRAGEGGDLTRVCELLQRTNQFNTSLVRYSEGELLALLALPEHAVYCLDAEDRFGHYGLVGACILRAEVIDTLAISCRVIGLKVALPFLASSLVQHGRAHARAFMHAGPRNHPCRDVFEQAGFSADGEGWFSLRDPVDLIMPDPAIYEMTPRISPEPVRYGEMS